MGAKGLRIEPIAARDANAVIRQHHYSGKVAHCSQVHLGVFFGGRLEGAIQFGLPIDKRKVIGLVRATPWNGMVELNRMAFSDRLPRNSESRALAVSMRLLRGNYPFLQWVLSYSDATRCGDGTIYRAAGFSLTAIKKNRSMLQMPDGSIVSDKMLNNVGRVRTTGGGASYWKAKGAKPLHGFQIRYIYFLDPGAKGRLTVPVLPYSAIELAGAKMYRGEARAASIGSDAPGPQPGEGGATPTAALHSTCGKARRV